MKQNKKVEMIKAVGLLSIILAVSGMAAMVSADSFPSRPNQFYGNVTLYGMDAPAGTNISAYIDSELRGSLEIATDGEYGYDLNYLSVNGNEDDVITFTIGGVLADENITWCGVCGPRKLDLSAGDYVSVLPKTGDIDGDGDIDFDDAWYLAMYMTYGGFGYDLHADGDVNSSGDVDFDDAWYLAMHVLYGECFPLYPPV